MLYSLQCLQRLQQSRARPWGHQPCHARADHPTLHHFFPATLRQRNMFPTSLSAVSCQEAFRTGLRASTSASRQFLHDTSVYIIYRCVNLPMVYTITLLTFYFFNLILTVCFKRAYTAPPKRTNFLGLLTP